MSRLEFSIVVSVVAVLAGVLLWHLPELQAESERLLVEQTTRHMRLGIQNAVAQHIMRHEEDRIVEVVMSNPMDFLEHKTDGFRRSSPGSGEVGTWAYDQSARLLSYWPRFRENFDGSEVLQWTFVPVIDSSGKAVGAYLARRK